MKASKGGPVPIRLDSGTKAAIRQAGGYRGCAYLYADGIAVKTEEEARVGGQRVRVECWRVIRANVPLVVESNKGPHGEALGWQEAAQVFQPGHGRIVVHNPTLLLDGLAQVRVYFCNTTKAEEEAGIPGRTTVTLETASGMRIRLDDEEHRLGDVKVQAEVVEPIEKVAAYYRYHPGCTLTELQAGDDGLVKAVQA